jgi:biopolymer transport protein TolQ
LEAFWGTKRLDAIYSRTEGMQASPVAQMFRAGYVELGKIRQGREAQTAAASGAAATGTGDGDLANVGRSMQRAQANEMARLESLLSVLATVGSTAPFIGLLGTVIGIINAFYDIGAMGNASLATVAPGIGGALVATAFGLFAAIPAVMAYNLFLSRVRQLDTEMQMFSADFLNIVKRHFF